MSRVYRFALATVLATLALIAVGGLARLQPAGSGCGNDWPRCNGSWAPPLAWAPLIEYLHRGIALAVIFLTLATAVAAKEHGEEDGRSPNEVVRRLAALAPSGMQKGAKPTSA